MKHSPHRGLIPALERAEFERRLRVACPEIELGSDTMSALYAHFSELRRWNRSVSLVGPGTVETIVERHYAESLAALPFVGRGRLVDLGSGAGFPGLILAIACESLEVTLVESRQRKAAFLEWTAQRSRARCRVVCARIATPLPVDLPDEIEFVTLRAVALDKRVWDVLRQRLAPEGRVLHWTTGRQALPGEGLELETERPLPGDEGRRLRVLRPAGLGGKDRDESSS